MKRKESTVPQDVPSIGGARNEQITETAEEVHDYEDERLFLIEDGQLRPFSSQNYTTSVLYQAIDAFDVERKLVPPESSNNIVFEGKKPSKKTVPILVSGDGKCTLLESWEDLETKTEQLADAQEVLGAAPVKQVFVLKKK